MSGAGADGSPADHRVLGLVWRERVVELLGPITDMVTDRSIPRGDWLVLDDHRVRLARQCAARPADDATPYVESARNAARRVALAVLGRMSDDPGLDPLTAFDRVLADRDEVFSPRLAGWIDLLGPGGRGALAQEACGRVAAIAAWVPPARLREVTVSGPNDTFTWEVPGRAVQVKSRGEALAPRGARPAGCRILVVASTLAGARAAAGHAALAYTVSRASVPARVTVLVPASGREAYVVDEELLDRALERLGLAAHAAVAARFGPPAATTSGTWCRWCPRLDECDDGQAWQASHPVRVGGLLPLDPAI